MPTMPNTKKTHMRSSSTSLNMFIDSSKVRTRRFRPVGGAEGCV